MVGHHMLCVPFTLQITQHPFTAGYIDTYIEHAQLGQATRQDSVSMITDAAACLFCQMLDCTAVRHLCGHQLWHADKGHADVHCTYVVLFMLLSLHHNQDVTSPFSCPCGLQAAWTPHVAFLIRHNHVCCSRKC